VQFLFSARTVQSVALRCVTELNRSIKVARITQRFCTIHFFTAQSNTNFWVSSRDPPTHGHAGSRRSLPTHHRSTGIRRRSEIRGPPLHIPTLYFFTFMFSVISRSLSFIFRMWRVSRCSC